MSLKIIKRKGRKFFYVRGTIRGQGIYECTETCDQAQAESYRIKRETELWTESVHGKRSVCTFAAAASSYLTFEPRSLSTVNAVDRLLTYFGSTLITHISQASLDGVYRGLLKEGVLTSPATKIRAVITPLQAILTHAAQMGWCDAPAFKKPKVAKTRVQPLYPAHVERLIQAAAPHAKPLFVLMVGTGVRLSEALELDWKDVDLRGGRCTVQQKQGNWRQVELCPKVLGVLEELPHRKGPVFLTNPTIDKDGRVLKKGQKYRTGDSVSGQIKRAWSTACRNAELPGEWRIWTTKKTKKIKKQWVSEFTPHSLRHTWASWHYCVHRDLLKLKEDGGWSTITMVTRYAKLMPLAYQGDIRAWMLNGSVNASIRAEDEPKLAWC